MRDLHLQALGLVPSPGIFGSKWWHSISLCWQHLHNLLALENCNLNLSNILAAFYPECKLQLNLSNCLLSLILLAAMAWKSDFGSVKVIVCCLTWSRKFWRHSQLKCRLSCGGNLPRGWLQSAAMCHLRPSSCHQTRKIEILWIPIFRITW